MGMAFSMLDHGMGRHAWFLSESDLNIFLKLSFAINLVFDFCLFATKACALLFFNRVFPKRANAKWFNWAIWITHGLNFAWLVGIVIATFFLCQPLEKYWKPEVDGTCGDSASVHIGSALSSVFIDLCILLLPLPKIWGLQMSIVRKGGLMLVFLLGYLYVFQIAGNRNRKPISL